MESLKTCSHYLEEQTPLLAAKISEYWKSPAGIMRRAESLSQVFNAKVFNNAVKTLGSTGGATWMQWVTAADDKVCPVCAANSSKGSKEHPGWFKSGWFTPDMPAHPNCRCQWEIWYDPGEEAPEAPGPVDPRDFERHELTITQETKIPSTTYDAKSRGRRRKVSSLKTGKIGDTDIWMVNGGSKKWQTLIEKELSDIPVEDFKGLKKLQLINAQPKRKLLRSRPGVKRYLETRGYCVRFMDKRRLITVYTKQDSPQRAIQTLMHEIGHNKYWIMFDEEIAVSRESAKLFTQDWRTFWNDNIDNMPTGYSITSEREGFAECYMSMKIDPGGLHIKIFERMLKYGISPSSFPRPTP